MSPYHFYRVWVLGVALFFNIYVNCINDFVQIGCVTVFRLVHIASKHALLRQEAHKPKRSPANHSLYIDFLSEGLIFAYEQPYRRINKDQQ